jgi:hypothetical protein
VAAELEILTIGQEVKARRLAIAGPFEISGRAGRSEVQMPMSAIDAVDGAHSAASKVP